MPVNQLLVWISDIVIIVGNMYLYTFLQRNTDRRTKGDTCPRVTILKLETKAKQRFTKFSQSQN